MTVLYCVSVVLFFAIYLHGGMYMFTVQGITYPASHRKNAIHNGEMAINKCAKMST